MITRRHMEGNLQLNDSQIPLPFKVTGGNVTVQRRLSV